MSFNNFLAQLFVQQNKRERIEDGIIQKHYFASKYFPFYVRTFLVRIDLKLWKACISNYPQTIITISDDRVAWQFTRPLAAALCTQSATQFPMLPVNISGLTWSMCIYIRWASGNFGYNGSGYTLDYLGEDDDVERTAVMIRNEVSIRSLLEPVSVNDASRILGSHRNRFEFIACLYRYLYIRIPLLKFILSKFFSFFFIENYRKSNWLYTFFLFSQLESADTFDVTSHKYN